MGFDNEAHYFFFEAFESQSPMGKVALCPNLNV